MSKPTITEADREVAAQAQRAYGADEWAAKLVAAHREAATADLRQKLAKAERERDDSRSIQTAEKQILLDEIEAHVKTKAEVKRLRKVVKNLLEIVRDNDIERALDALQAALRETKPTEGGKEGP